MGYAFNNVCYPTFADAALANCATQYPQFVANGSMPVYLFCEGVSGSALIVNSKPLGSYTTIRQPLNTAFPQCDPNTYPGNEFQLDSVKVAAVFSVAFTFVVLFYLVARGAGSVLSLIRRG